MKFSQRMGITPVADVIQLKEMNGDLRNGLWNVLLAEVFDKEEFLSEPTDVHGLTAHQNSIDEFTRAVWSDFFKGRVDERPGRGAVNVKPIRDFFFASQWYEVYNFIEFCVEYYGECLVEPLNRILERELSGYRIIDGKVAPITSAPEIEAIQDAIDDKTFPGASAHLRAALDHLSRKENPDCRNSIKESISAVESACCALTGSPSASLGDALKALAETHALHGALKKGFSNLYGYTSDGDGIRHAMLEESNLTQADAVYFLVSCSAFVNYLKVKSSR